jgi:hypothetical protein
MEFRQKKRQAAETGISYQPLSIGNKISSFEKEGDLLRISSLCGENGPVDRHYNKATLIVWLRDFLWVSVICE